VVPEDSNCSHRSFRLAGWSKAHNSYYYIPDAPGCSLVYERDGYSVPLPFLRRYGLEECGKRDPRFFLHDSGTCAFSKYQPSSEDVVTNCRVATGPPFSFTNTDRNAITPDKFFDDDIQLNFPDLLGQPLLSDSKFLSISEFNEYGDESDESNNSFESDWYGQWVRDLKWAQDSGLAIGSVRRTIWRKDHWGIEFNLEPVSGQLEFGDQFDEDVIKNYMVKATVLRLFVMQGKLESDANTRRDDRPGKTTLSEVLNGGNGGDYLAARLTEAHIY